MSYIYGLFNGDRSIVNKEEALKVRERLKKGVVDNEHLWSDHNIIIGNLTIYNSKESINEKLPYYDRESDLVITSDARIDNREELINLLSVKNNDVPDSILILRSYQKWGESCSNYLHGDFTFVIWDKQKQKIFMSRDRMGMKPCFYYYKKGQLVFASTIKAIEALPFVKSNLNDEWVTYFLLGQSHPNGFTINKDIFRLLPAHNLVVQNGQMRITRYFEFGKGNEIRLKSDKEYEEAFLEKLENAVKIRTRSFYPVGTELSGGLDSSSITLLAHKYLSNTNGLHIFSNVLPDKDLGKIKPFTDERESIQKVLDYTNNKFESINYLFLECEEQIDIIKKHLCLAREPIAKDNYGSHLSPLFKAASPKNVRTILSGLGGDEVVSYNGSLFSENLLYKLKIQEYLKSICQLSYKDKRFIPRLYAGNIYRDFQKIFMNIKRTPNKKNFLYKYLNKDFIESSRIKELMNSLENRKNKINTLKDCHIHFLSHERYISRIEASALHAAQYGIEYRYPLLDVNLVEFFLSIPSSQKVKNGWGRSLLRRSMKGVLPESIRWREDKFGDIIPSVFGLFQKSKHNIKQSFMEMKNQDILGKYFDVKLLESEIDTFGKEGGKSVNRAIFNCLWLDIWLSKNY